MIVYMYMASGGGRCSYRPLQSKMEDGSAFYNLHGEFYTRYEPRELLGRGLSSTVRKCISRETGHEFAVKIIDKSQDSSIIQCIEAEVETLTNLPAHPNIIHLRDKFESETYIFLVFELASGGELFDYLTKMVRLSEKRTRQVMQQLLSAVEHIHDHKYIHRDLKPENILLDKNMQVKVSDFGFSIHSKHNEYQSELLGTPGYLAPEMLQRSIDPSAPGYNRQVDMWACGVIMYTLLAGFPPFWHRKQLVMLRNIMDGRYKFVSPEWDDISEKAKDLIRKLLVVDYNKRLTATEAYNHPFLQIQPAEFIVFSPRRKMKAIIDCVWFCNVLQKLRRTPKTVTLGDITPNPYSNRYIRKMIDSCAFSMYGHWVKRGEEQNRAALFETTPKLAGKTSETNMGGVTIIFN